MIYKFVCGSCIVVCIGEGYGIGICWYFVDCLIICIVVLGEGIGWLISRRKGCKRVIVFVWVGNVVGCNRNIWWVGINGDVFYGIIEVVVGYGYIILFGRYIGDCLSYCFSILVVIIRSYIIIRIGCDIKRSII